MLEEELNWRYEPRERGVGESEWNRGERENERDERRMKERQILTNCLEASPTFSGLFFVFSEDVEAISFA